MKRACCVYQVKMVPQHLESDFSNDVAKRKLIRKIWGNMQCLTGKGKMSLVRIFRNFLNTKDSRNWDSTVVASDKQSFTLVA